MPKVLVKCTNCENDLYRWPSHAKAGKYGNFCDKDCLGEFRTKHLTGSLAANFKLGSNFDRKYININAHWHPKKRYDNTVYLHRVIMEARLGRFLKDDEIVHHIDGNQENNHWDNLQVMTQAEHAREHIEERRNIITGKLEKGVNNGN